MMIEVSALVVVKQGEVLVFYEDKDSSLECEKIEQGEKIS
jgi:hypothetical protein